MEPGQAVLLAVDLSDEVAVFSRRKPHARKGNTRFRDPVQADPFPQAVDVRIPEGHIVRQLMLVLTNTDLRQITRLYAHRGGMPYNPVNLLAVVIFGMMDGVRESRSLEEHCKYDVRYRFLMAGHEPDDRTFGRFLERMDEKIDVVFAQVMARLRQGRKRAGAEVIIDGAKVACDASWWKYCKLSEEAPSDPDARLQNSHGRKLVGYNAQVVIDSSDNTILAAEVLSDQSDQHAGSKVMETLKLQHGPYPAALIADKGYDTYETIQALEDAGIDSVICPDKLTECLAEDAEGVLRCPIGKELVKWKSQPNGRGTLYDVYKPEGGCRNCPISTTCLFKNKLHHVPEGADPGARFRNRARVRSMPYDDAMFKRRNVERVFAGLKHDGFLRFLRRGRKKVRTEFILWSLSYNFRALLRCIITLFQALATFLGKELSPEGQPQLLRT